MSCGTQTKEIDLNPIHPSTVEFYVWHAHRYGETHPIEAHDLPPNLSMNFVCLRMQWAMDMAGMLVTGKFSEAEHIAFMDCCVADRFSPEKSTSIESRLCGNLGIGLSERESSQYREFFMNLCELEAIRRKAKAYIRNTTCPVV